MDNNKNARAERKKRLKKQTTADVSFSAIDGAIAEHKKISEEISRNIVQSRVLNEEVESSLRELKQLQRKKIEVEEFNQEPVKEVVKFAQTSLQSTAEKWAEYMNSSARALDSKAKKLQEIAEEKEIKIVSSADFKTKLHQYILYACIFFTMLAMVIVWAFSNKANKYNLVKYQLEQERLNNQFTDELKEYYLTTSRHEKTKQAFSKVSPETAETLENNKDSFKN